MSFCSVLNCGSVSTKPSVANNKISFHKTAYNRTMEKQPDEPEDFTNEPLPSISEPIEVEDDVASTLATPFAQPIIAASKSKAQKQREYRQRIAASRTPAQAAAARKSKNERQRNNRLRQAANLAIASGSLEATTTSSSRSGEESNNVQTRSQRQHAQQQSNTTADQPDKRVNLTNEPLIPAIPVPMEVQEAVASSSATPFAEPISAAPKTRAQIQREYRQRIAASKTPAQAAAAREARNVRDRNNRLCQAANLAIASGSLEATTTSSSRSGQRFPANNLKRRHEWIKATCKKNWMPSSYSKICSLHFTEDSYFTNMKIRMLNNSAIPTLLLPTIDPNSDENSDKKNNFLKLEIDNSNIMSQLEAIETLLNSLHDTHNDRFEIFSRIVAAQLKSLPFLHALELKTKLEEVIFEYRTSLIQDGVIFPEIKNVADKIVVCKVKGKKRRVKDPTQANNNINQSMSQKVTDNTVTNNNESKLESTKIQLPYLYVEKTKNNPVVIIDSDEDEEQCNVTSINLKNTAQVTSSHNKIPDSKESITIKNENEYQNPQLNFKIESIHSLNEESNSSEDLEENIKEETQIELTEEMIDDSYLEAETLNNIKRENYNDKNCYIRVKRFASEPNLPIQDVKKLKK